MYIIAVYDINTQDKAGQKRLNQIFKMFKKYLVHIQNSVFEGELTKAQYAKMEMEVRKIIDKEIDSVIFFSNRNIKWMDKEVLGLEKRSTDNFL